MSDCNHNCSSCGKTCSDRKSMLATNNKYSNIKKIIAVTSGKGGVGKSMVTSLLAVSMMKKGYKVGILDADITGPSIPYSFGIHEQIYGTEEGMIPSETKNGIKVVSINLLLDNPNDPVAWRGPILANAVKQFYTDVSWGDIDFLFVDMPPGTGDVALTVFQSLPVDETIIVSSPQDMVKMIVGKAVKMCKMMNVDLLGLVENMAYMICPCCNNPIYPFGPSKINEVAESFDMRPLASLAINPTLASYVDAGKKLKKLMLKNLIISQQYLKKIIIISYFFNFGNNVIYVVDFIFFNNKNK
ncbi:MAG: Mrp/NBP35 family ATP-binding protein [Clostridium sp.]|nr:MAG: Mrp/NBP35 family ATP-binding protein [Clostridium sp.]